jgi:hypothetical protein
MLLKPQELAQVRLDNALALFEEFVRATARHADAATLRGLERRFAERIQIQPSYWSQIKGRSRQIGERLARQFEQLCHKPTGWMDVPHAGLAGAAAALLPLGQAAASSGAAAALPSEGGAPQRGSTETTPQDDDERFIVGLVLSYYRRHPQRARARLLDILGEVLTPAAAPVPSAPKAAAKPDGTDLWQRTRQGVAPLKPRR